MKKIPILIDTDPGIDDLFCIALGCAFREVFDLKALTTIGGNNSTAVTTANALKILKLFKREDVPVAKGADSYLEEPFGEPVSRFHGHNGIGDVAIPDSDRKPVALSACDMIYETARECAGELVVVTVGPETNLALALRKYPELKQLIRKITVMGGTLDRGNISPYAEANIGHDIAAAAIVFSSGIPIDMIGLNVTRTVPLKKELFAGLQDVDKTIRDVMLKLIAFRNEEAMHDSIAISSLLDENIITFKDAHTTIITKGEKAGMTYADYDRTPNSRVATAIDTEAYYKLMIEMLKKL